MIALQIIIFNRFIISERAKNFSVQKIFFIPIYVNTKSFIYNTTYRLISKLQFTIYCQTI